MANFNQVGHDCATFIPYPDASSGFNLMITIKYFETEDANKIKAEASLVGLYGSEYDKSCLFTKTLSKEVLLDTNGLDYTKWFEQNYENKEVVDKVLTELASVFNENFGLYQGEFIRALETITQED